MAPEASAEDQLMFDQASAAAALDEREALRAEYEAALKAWRSDEEPGRATAPHGEGSAIGQEAGSTR